MDTRVKNVFIGQYEGEFKKKYFRREFIIIYYATAFSRSDHLTLPYEAQKTLILDPVGSNETLHWF